MGKIRIHFAYKHVDRPWGGANSFIRSLYGYLQSTGSFAFTDQLDEPCDILFLNQTATGPGGDGKKIASKQVQRLKKDRKIVARAVNLNAHAFNKGPRYWLFGRSADRETLRVLNMADLVLFQSAYQKDVFIKAGYKGQNSLVIHNGADPLFVPPLDPLPLLDGDKVRIVSSTASPRSTKQHFLISRLSRQPDVEIFHFGAWPKDLERGQVKLMGTVKHEEMASFMHGCHYFLHPAIKDPCPNAVFEAICAGLPVIYFDGPGSSQEIVSACGFPMIQGDDAATLSKARTELARLRRTIASSVASYGAGRAAEAYRQAFVSVFESGARKGSGV